MYEPPKIKEFLKFLEKTYGENPNNRNLLYQKSVEKLKFFHRIMSFCIDTSNLSDEDKLFMRQYYNTLSAFYKDCLEKDLSAPSPRTTERELKLDFLWK